MTACTRQGAEIELVGGLLERALLSTSQFAEPGAPTRTLSITTHGCRIRSSSRSTGNARRAVDNGCTSPSRMEVKPRTGRRNCGSRPRHRSSGQPRRLPPDSSLVAVANTGPLFSIVWVRRMATCPDHPDSDPDPDTEQVRERTVKRQRRRTESVEETVDERYESPEEAREVVLNELIGRPISRRSTTTSVPTDRLSSPERSGHFVADDATSRGTLCVPPGGQGEFPVGSVSTARSPSDGSDPPRFSSSPGGAPTPGVVVCGASSHPF